MIYHAKKTIKTKFLCNGKGVGVRDQRSQFHSEEFLLEGILVFFLGGGQQGRRGGEGATVQSALHL